MATDNINIVGSKIKGLRETKQLSIEEIAERSGLSPEQIISIVYESQKVSKHTVENKWRTSFFLSHLPFLSLCPLFFRLVFFFLLKYLAKRLRSFSCVAALSSF